MLMNDFDKTFLSAFYYFFLKIKLNCENKNVLNLNTCSFQRKMFSNLKYVLIYSLTTRVLEDGFKQSCVLKIL